MPSRPLSVGVMVFATLDSLEWWPYGNFGSFFTSFCKKLIQLYGRMDNYAELCRGVQAYFSRSRYIQELEPAKICYNVYAILNLQKTKMPVL